MSGFVLDASTALSWAFDDESSPYSDAVLNALVDGFAVVPSLWPLEMANGLTTALRRSRISPDGVAGFAQDLATFDIRIDDAVPDPLALASEAYEIGVTAYDAAYVDIARRLLLPIASRNRALVRAATASNVPVFSVK